MAQEIIKEEQAVQEKGRTQKLKLSEKLAFGIGDAGANFVWTFTASFMTIYLTDTVGMAAGIIGTIILIARMFDGVSDLFMGSIIDNTNSRMGKAKPWVFWTAPILGILVILMFNVPDGLDNTGNIIYVSIIYLLISAVFYTANNVAYSSLTSFMTNDAEDRVSLGSIRFIFAIMAVLFINAFTTRIVQGFGGGQTGWGRTSILYAILCAIPLMITGYFVKERNVAKQVDGSTNRIPLKKIFGALFKNKYFYLIFGFYFLIYVRMSAAGSAVYYATYVLGDANYMTLLSFASMLPSLIVLLFYSKVVAKLGGLRKTITIGLFLTIAGYLIMFIGSETPGMLATGLVVTSIGGGPLTAAGSALVADMGDYVYWDSGIPVQGTAFSTTSAGMKLGQGLASAIVGWALALGSYVPNAIQQPASAITAMKFLYIYLPLFTCLLMLILMKFIDIEEYMPKIREDISNELVGDNKSI